MKHCIRRPHCTHTRDSAVCSSYLAIRFTANSDRYWDRGILQTCRYGFNLRRVIYVGNTEKLDTSTLENLFIKTGPTQQVSKSANNKFAFVQYEEKKT